MRFEVIQNDAVEVLRGLSADLCLTDPPYGVSERTARLSNGRSNAAASYDFPPVVGDDEPFDPSHLLRFKKVILWGANYYADKLPCLPSWFVWDKREGTTSDDNADCEMAWTNLGTPARLFPHLWRGMIKASERDERRVHPTQKPVALMRWCIEQAKLPQAATIIDPYCGSGSVGVAAVTMGFNFIGIEIDPHYCQVARARISRACGVPCDIPKVQRVERDLPLFREAVA